MRKVLFLFGVLDDSDFEWMISAGSVLKLPSGKILIQQGCEIDAVYIVLDGLLSVNVKGAAEREIAQLHAGEIVGEMSFVDSRPPSATVIAKQDSKVLGIPRAALQRRLDNDGFAARFYKALALFLADRLRATSAGYGGGEPQSGSANELDPLILDRVAVAGLRFDHLLRRLGNQ